MSKVKFVEVLPKDSVIFEQKDKYLASTIQIKNTDQQYKIAFKVKSTNPDVYSVRPNQAMVNPGDQTSIQISRKPLQKPDEQINDKFMVMAIIVKDNEIELSQAFKSTPSTEIQQEKLYIKIKSQLYSDLQKEKLLKSNLEALDKMKQEEQLYRSTQSDLQKSQQLRASGVQNQQQQQQNLEQQQYSQQQQQPSLLRSGNQQQDYETKYQKAQQEYNIIKEQLKQLEEEKQQLRGQREELKQSIQKQKEVKIEKQQKSIKGFGILYLILTILIGILLGFFFQGN